MADRAAPVSGCETLCGLYCLVLVESTDLPEVPSLPSLPPLCHAGFYLAVVTVSLLGLYLAPTTGTPGFCAPRFCLLSLDVGKDVALRPGLVCPTLPECRSGSSPRGVACGSALGSKWAVAREGCCPAEEDTSALPGHPISGLALGTGQKGAQTDLWCLPHLSFVLCC